MKSNMLLLATILTLWLPTLSVAGDGDVCFPPTDLEVCQIFYGNARELLVQWQNTQSYDEVSVYFDGMENSVLGGEETGIILQLSGDISNGDRTIGVLGHCGPMDSSLTTDTIDVVSETLHPDPISGDVECEFDDQFNGIMTASWTPDDPSDFVHVFIARGEDRIFVGRLDGKLTAVEIINTLTTDAIVVQFFVKLGNGCYGSELIECRPDIPGLRFIRGDYDGNSTFGERLQRGSSCSYGHSAAQPNRPAWRRAT